MSRTRSRGKFTTYSGERYIYHMKGDQYYGKTKPERSYALGGPFFPSNQLVAGAGF